MPTGGSVVAGTSYLNSHLQDSSSARGGLPSVT